MVHDDRAGRTWTVCRVEFDDERAVSRRGCVLVATLAERLGIEELVGRAGAVAPRIGRARRTRAAR